ncbi:murein biosynthesis integral membrane protein MurJ [candidate division KSB1 bacterium]|nr:MAG: murein biosynthesis integral membrane protein MurJ [candidate division KSB1 bacterium]
MLSKQSIVRASVIMSSAALISRMLGFIREVIIAKFYGATSSYDLYLIAVTFPIVLISTLLYTIPNTFIPAYLKEKAEKGSKGAWNFLCGFFTYWVSFIFLISFLLFLFAPKVIALFVPDLSAGDKELVVNILRMTASVVFFGGVFSLFKSVLNANKHFLVPAYAPIVLNIIIILSIVLFSGTIKVKAIAVGLVAGYFIQAFIVFILVEKKIGLKISFSLTQPALINAFQVLFVILLIEILGQLYVVVDRMFYSALPEGSISSINYANTLFQIPIAALGITVGSAIFPTLSEYVADNKFDQLHLLIEKTINIIIIITVPIIGVFIFFSKDLVSVVFQRGAFDVNASFMTSNILMFLSFGLIAFVLHAIVVRIHYSLGNKIIILVSTSIAIAVKIISSYILVPKFSYNGLAVATSISIFINLSLLIFMLERKKIYLNFKVHAGNLFIMSLITVISILLSGYVSVLLFEERLIFKTISELFLSAFLIIVFILLFNLEDIRKYFLTRFVKNR